MSSAPALLLERGGWIYCGDLLAAHAPAAHQQWHGHAAAADAGQQRRCCLILAPSALLLLRVYAGGRGGTRLRIALQAELLLCLLGGVAAVL